MAIEFIGRRCLLQPIFPFISSGLLSITEMIWLAPFAKSGNATRELLLLQQKEPFSLVDGLRVLPFQLGQALLALDHVSGKFIRRLDVG